MAMNSMEELELRNTLMTILKERRFAPELYPVIRDNDYWLFKGDDIYKVIDEIVGLVSGTDIDIDTGGFGIPVINE